jgi:hypothetical protein
MIVSVVIALIFSSTYANQTYDNYTDAVSRTAVIFITVLFCGVVGMNSVQSVVFGDRPAFYREQQSEEYDIVLYTITATIVEVRVVSISFSCPLNHEDSLLIASIV